MRRIPALLIALSMLSVAAAGAVAQATSPDLHATPPDQAAAPPGSDPNLGDGTGGGPGGTIGDPNGAGAGSAEQASEPAVIVGHPAPPAETGVSKSDQEVLRSCQTMSRRAMRAASQCKALMLRHPELFGANAGTPPRQ